MPQSRHFVPVLFVFIISQWSLSLFFWLRLLQACVTVTASPWILSKWGESPRQVHVNAVANRMRIERLHHTRKTFLLLPSPFQKWAELKWRSAETRKTGHKIFCQASDYKRGVEIKRPLTSCHLAWVRVSSDRAGVHFTPCALRFHLLPETAGPPRARDEQARGPNRRCDGGCRVTGDPALLWTLSFFSPPSHLWDEMWRRVFTVT